MMKRITKS